MPPADATPRARGDYDELLSSIRELLATAPPRKGLTVTEVAQRHRVGEDRVRAWIKSGALKAINTADAKCGKPRFIILPEALAEFEQSRSAGPPPKLPRPRRRATGAREWFPD
jgi:hypothetical protein